MMHHSSFTLNCWEILMKLTSSGTKAQVFIGNCNKMIFEMYHISPYWIELLPQQEIRFKQKQSKHSIYYCNIALRNLKHVWHAIVLLLITSPCFTSKSCAGELLIKTEFMRLFYYWVIVITYFFFVDSSKEKARISIGSEAALQGRGWRDFI